MLLLHHMIKFIEFFFKFINKNKNIYDEKIISKKEKNDSSIVNLL
jgi:hypothetical protein